MNTKEIEAKPTLFNGTLYRSRLEARWAVLFTELEIPFEYEPKKFDLNSVWYIPDFWLPQENSWLEIKPKMPSSEESWKASQLAIVDNHDVLMFYGSVTFQSFTCRYCNEHHYTEIPTGVGISKYLRNTGSSTMFSLQLDEFFLALKQGKNELPSNVLGISIHELLMPIHQAFYSAMLYRFDETTKDSRVHRYTLWAIKLMIEKGRPDLAKKLKAQLFNRQE